MPTMIGRLIAARLRGRRCKMYQATDNTSADETFEMGANDSRNSANDVQEKTVADPGQAICSTLRPTVVGMVFYSRSAKLQKKQI